MIDKYYKILGVQATDSDEVIQSRYEELKSKYQEERFLEGDVGNNAAKMLTEIEIAYNEIKSYRNEFSVEGEKSEAFSSVEAAIKSGNLTAAQQLLDDFNERSAEWHYYQSVIFYKKNWINESKKQLEIAISMDGSVQKYKNALNKIDERVNQGAKINNDWNRSGNANYQRQDGDPEQQLGGDSCAQWCCDMIICNTMLNCCCNCR